MSRTDEELVARSMDGDRESFNELVVRWQRPVYALAYRVIGREEDARDVSQEAFLRAFRAIKSFRGQAKFSSWIYRITLNLCRDWIRRERRRPLTLVAETPEVSEPGSAAPTAEDLATQRDLGQRVATVMAQLPEEQRAAIVLKEYHGLTFKEIADLQRCPLSTVKTRLYQGLSVLRRELRTAGVPVPTAADRASRSAPGMSKDAR